MIHQRACEMARDKFLSASCSPVDGGPAAETIHHLGTVDNDDVLDKFFEHMFLMLTAAMDNMHRYKEHSDFLDALDRIKFS